jgi:hypothetical protein
MRSLFRDLKVGGRVLKRAKYCGMRDTHSRVAL